MLYLTFNLLLRSMKPAPTKYVITNRLIAWEATNKKLSCC